MQALWLDNGEFYFIIIFCDIHSNITKIYMVKSEIVRNCDLYTNTMRMAICGNAIIVLKVTIFPGVSGKWPDWLIYGLQLKEVQCFHKLLNSALCVLVKNISTVGPRAKSVTLFRIFIFNSQINRGNQHQWWLIMVG